MLFVVIVVWICCGVWKLGSWDILCLLCISCSVGVWCSLRLWKNVLLSVFSFMLSSIMFLVCGVVVNVVSDSVSIW